MYSVKSTQYAKAFFMPLFLGGFGGNDHLGKKVMEVFRALAFPH